MPEGERAISPVVIVTDQMASSPQEIPCRADSATNAMVPTIRVRTEELRRSASSPQVNFYLNSPYN